MLFYELFQHAESGLGFYPICIQGYYPKCIPHYYSDVRHPRCVSYNSKGLRVEYTQSNTTVF